MKFSLMVVAACIALSGCQSAVISSTKWDSGASVASHTIETRCHELDMRNDEEMKAKLTKYDGWKMVYVSEYTTGNKMGTSGVVCFERAK